MGADLVAACPKPEAGTKEVGGCGHPPLRVSVERGSSGNQPFSVGAALMAQGSQQFIGRVKRVAAEFGRVLATPEEARAILGLK